MNDDGFYTPEEGAAIATFIEQLPYICGETLSRRLERGRMGRRRFSEEPG